MLPSEVGAGMWSLALPDLSILMSYEVKFVMIWMRILGEMNVGAGNKIFYT